MGVGDPPAEHLESVKVQEEVYKNIFHLRKLNLKLPADENGYEQPLAETDLLEIGKIFQPQKEKNIRTTMINTPEGQGEWGEHQGLADTLRKNIFKGLW